MAQQADRTRIAGYGLESAPGHLIRRCQQRAIELFFEEVGEDGPTPQQFAVLLNLYKSPGMRQTDLVRACAIDRSTLTDVVRRMISRGWITRRRDATDQRANALSLTEAGTERLIAAFDAALRAQERILDPIAPEERDMAMRALAALAGPGEKTGA